MKFQNTLQIFEVYFYSLLCIFVSVEYFPYLFKFSPEQYCQKYDLEQSEELL